MSSPLIVALDCASAREALALAAQLEPRLCRFKVGKQLFTRCGPALVEELQGRGFEVFLDLKFHDIPNTVAAAVAVAAELGVWMISLHASGGRRMMVAAREALGRLESPPLLIGVTLLTSLSEVDLRELGYRRGLAGQVAQLAELAAASGLDGVVCSAREAAELRQLCGQNFKLVTPGIRMAGDEPGDQRRVVTPARAMASGSDYLVVGRPITQAPDPLAKVRGILADLDE